MENTESSLNNGTSEPGGSSRRLGERFDRVSDSAQHAWTSTRDSLTDLRDRLDLYGRVDRNPYGMLAAALGVGYVLGGGIFSPLTGRILGMGLRIGIRLAAIPFLKEEVLGMVAALGEAQGEGESAEAGPESGATGGGRRKSKKSSDNPSNPINPNNPNRGRQP